MPDTRDRVPGIYNSISNIKRRVMSPVHCIRDGRYAGRIADDAHVRSRIHQRFHYVRAGPLAQCADDRSAGNQYFLAFRVLAPDALSGNFQSLVAGVNCDVFVDLLKE